MRKVLLYSGGVDSVCLRHLWQPDVLLHVDYGGRYSALERSMLPAGAEVIEHQLGQYERPDAVLPLRNLFLVALATMHYQKGDLLIALGSMAGDRIRDNQAPFASMASEMLTYLWGRQWWHAGRQVAVVQPLHGYGKDEAVREYLAAGGEPAQLQATTSCYTPRNDRPCGECEPCANRWVALAANGISSAPDCRAYVERHELPRMRAEAVLAALGSQLPPVTWQHRAL